jgi:hypothetical protein
MQRFLITLKGISPLLQNAMTENDLGSLRDKTKKQSKSAAKLTMEEEAKLGIHYNRAGQACIPNDMLMAALINAGVFIRLDQKRQLSTKESSLLPGLLFLEDDNWPLLLPGDGEEARWGFAPWRYATHRGRNPNGGEAVCIVRPMFELWAITLTALLDIDELPEDTFLRLFTLAGTRMGLGDFRPQRKGRFGMFAITRWEKTAGPIDLMPAPKMITAA